MFCVITCWLSLNGQLENQVTLIILIRATAELWIALKFQWKWSHLTSVKYSIYTTTEWVIFFMSAGWPGKTKDTEIVKRCGLLENLSPVDGGIAGQRFDIRNSIHLKASKSPAMGRNCQQAAVWHICLSSRAGTLFFLQNRQARSFGPSWQNSQDLLRSSQSQQVGFAVYLGRHGWKWGRKVTAAWWISSFTSCFDCFQKNVFMK